MCKTACGIPQAVSHGMSVKLNESLIEKRTKYYGEILTQTERHSIILV